MLGAMRVASALFLLLVGLSGCLPIPNRRMYAPRIEGAVLRDGAALEGAVVRLDPHFGPEVEVRTDAAGRFSIGPVTKLYLTKSFGDPVYKYDLTIEAADGRYLGLSRSELGAAPDDLRVVCDLAKPQSHARRGRQSGELPHHCAAAP